MPKAKFFDLALKMKYKVCAESNKKCTELIQDWAYHKKMSDVVDVDEKITLTGSGADWWLLSSSA